MKNIGAITNKSNRVLPLPSGKKLIPLEIDKSPHSKLPPLERSSPTFNATLGTSVFVSKVSPSKQRRMQATKFEALTEDVTQSAHFVKLADRNVDADSNIADYIAYKVENMIAADANYRFYILLSLTIGTCVLFTVMWTVFVTPSDDVRNSGDALFMVFQVEIEIIIFF